MLLFNTILSIIIFVFVLCLFIVLSGKILEEKGEVTVLINNDKEITTTKGEKLLSILSENNIFLPAACGGKGNCGKCKIKINSGNIRTTSLERLLLSENEIKDNFRLACQVKVRENLSLEIPKELLLAHSFKAKLISIENLAYKIKRLKFKLENGEKLEFKSGQYLQITKELTWGKAIRAYSISSSPEIKEEFTLDVQLIDGGLMSSFLHELPIDSVIDFTGPFGDMFVNLNQTNDQNKKYLLIAGGVGLAPMNSIIDYFTDIKYNGNYTLFHGVRSKKNLYNESNYKNLSKKTENFQYIPVLSEPALEDGWIGETGLVTDSVSKWLDKNKENIDSIEAFLCGPSAMMESAKKILIEKGVDSNKIHSDPFSF